MGHSASTEKLRYPFAKTLSRIQDRLIQSGAEPTDTSWHIIIFYTTRKGWNEMNQFYVQRKPFVKYINLLNPVSRWYVSKGISFWYVPSWNWIPSFWTHFLKRFTFFSKFQHNSSWFMIAISSRIEVSAPTLCLSDPVHAFFQVSGTVRSTDPTGHGIPNTWKCSSSLIKTLRTPPTHLYWTGFEMTGYHLFLSMQDSADPYVPFRAKVPFEMCQLALLHHLYCEEEKIYCHWRNSKFVLWGFQLID
jgi:hypothetical protein